MPRNRSKQSLALMSLIGLVLFVWLNFFPPGEQNAENPLAGEEATTRKTAEQTALAFIEGHFGPGDWNVFAMYDANAAATGYLDKEDPGSDPAEVWPAAPLEFFRVEAEEEWSGSRLKVYVSAERPRVIGWETVAAEWSSEAVRHETGEEALRSLGYDPGQFAKEENPEGGKITYTHREKVGSLAFTLEVAVDDGRVVSVVPAALAPAELERLLEEYEFKGLLVSLATLFGSFLLGIGAIVFAAVYRKEMAFDRGIWLSLAFLVPLAAYTIGLYPALRLMFPFTPEGGIGSVLFQQGFNLVNAAIVYLSLVAGEGLWRKMGFRLWPGTREPEFVPAVKQSVWTGYLYAFIILGFQAVVLFVGFKAFGVWSTADPTTDIRNQLFQAGFPFLAWSAAISEEAVYRLFSIAAITMILYPLCRWMYRLTGKPVFLNPVFAIVPAALVSSILWGAAHVGYTVYPPYTRLIEVTLIGFLFSWLFIRHGLMAAIFAHATVDLIWMGIELAVSDSRYVPAGIAYLAMPVAVGYLLALAASAGRRRSSRTEATPER